MELEGAIALELARQGAFVIINYNGSKEKAEAVKAEIQADGGQAEISQCNVADFDACGTFIKEIVKTYGRIDILVNNAGITKDGLLMARARKISARLWTQILREPLTAFAIQQDKC